MEMQPTLKGELLELRPLTPEDYDDLFAVASDPAIWEQHPARDRYKADVFSAFFSEAIESRGALVALDSRTMKIIGSSRFHGYSESDNEIEIGWTFLSRAYWGGKYNREMKALMLRHAFRFVESVLFLVGPKNKRSQMAMQKIGGVRIGSRHDGDGRESIVFEITRSSFSL
jgi:N-acetyltransferase